MGKGSAPRQSRDDKAYQESWERIFRPKPPVVPEVPEGALSAKGCSHPFCQCDKKCEVKNG